MKSSVKIAVCGLSTALSVVLMFVCGFFYSLTYVAPLVLGFLMLIICKTFGAKSAFCVYFASAFLSLILVSQKECAVIYTLFFGYYPIIKQYLDKVKPKFLSVILKLLIFNACISLTEIICVYILGIPFFDDGVFSVSMIVVFAVLMNIVFIFYEIALKYFKIVYERKFEKRLIKIFK